MSLSKKNLDKLIKYKKNKNLNKDSNNISNYPKIDHNNNSTNNPLKFEDANKRVYQNNDYMEYYYLGIYAILFAWSHYVEIMEFYLEAYLPKINFPRIHINLIKLAFS